MKTRILTSFRKVLLRNALAFFFCTTMLASYHYVVAEYGDVSDFVTFAESEGPFAVTEVGGALVRGPETAAFTAGQAVGWQSSLCTRHGVAFVGHSDMMRLAQDGLSEQVVTERTTAFAADQVRCGPRLLSLQVPDDVVPGLYEIRPVLHFRVGSLWPLRTTLPKIAFRVQAHAAADAGSPAR